MDGWVGRKKDRVGKEIHRLLKRLGKKEKKNIQQKKKLYRVLLRSRSCPVAQRHMAHFDGWWWWLLLVDIYKKKSLTD